MTSDESEDLSYIDANEALLVEQIDESLRTYITAQDLSYVSFAPPSNNQNFANFNQYCGDLVSAFGTISALVLEVKFNTNGRLDNLNSDQQSGLAELFSRGIPVYYSYMRGDRTSR